MAAASNKLCKASTANPGGTGATVVYFRSNVNMYSGAFATASGISAAAANEQSNPAMPIKNLIRSGQLVRMTAVTKGTSTDPSRQIKILVTNEKAETISAAFANGTNTIPGITAGAIVAIRRANRMRLN